MNKIKYGIIYRIHNKVSDNNYIGKTTRSFKKRYGNLKGFIREKKTNTILHEDIEKYGIDSLEVFEEIDCVYKTDDEEYDKDLLSITESYYIMKYKGLSGYNIKECDYPLSISLFPNVTDRGSYINYKFELQDYYNFLFTDEHLNHFNKLTTTKRKDNYSKYLIKKYDEGNVFDDCDDAIKFREHWLNLHCFNSDIRGLYCFPNKHRWFNFYEFSKHHIDLYSSLKSCMNISCKLIGDGCSYLWFIKGTDYNEIISSYNNIRKIPWIDISRCIFFEKNNIDYIVLIKDMNVMYASDNTNLDYLLHYILDILNNDFKNRSEYNKQFDINKLPYKYHIEKLIKIRNDKLIKELKLNVNEL